MGKVKARASGLAVLASGVVFTFEKNGDIELLLAVNDTENLLFRFLFEDDDSGKQSVDANPTEQSLEIKCRNFNNALGTGMKRAIKVGSYHGESLYLTFMVYGREEQKKLEYCFFAGGYD